MTLRALIIAALLAALVALGGHFNDAYMRQTYMVGNLFPVSVVGMLVVLVVLVNPLLRRLRRAWELRAAELALIVIVPFAVCAVPGGGFLRTFTQGLVMPIHYEKSTPAWQKNEVLSYVPDRLLPGGGADSEAVVGNYIQGMRTQDSHIGLSGVPWRAWRGPLLFWIPLFGAVMLGLIGLSLVLHRQWVTHEHLVYPVAQFVGALSPGGPAAAGNTPAAGPAHAPGQDGARSIVSQRLFWYGLVPVFVLHVINGLSAWHPTFIRIPHELDLTPLQELLPKLSGTPGSGHLFRSTIYFTVVAFAYFLPSDITLSLGLTTFLSVMFAAALMTFGITIQRATFAASNESGLVFGAYLGFAGMLLFSGRAYYRRVVRAAFRGRAAGGPVEPSAVWGMRVFLAMMVLGALLMISAGLAWPFALLVLLLIVLMSVTISRICAETGLFFIQTGWHASSVLLGLFGAVTLGPAMLITATLICFILTLDSREAMMPFIVNGLRVGENAGLRKGRLALLMGGAFVIALLTATVLVFWLQYDRGVSFNDKWAATMIPKSPFKLLNTQIQELQANGTLERATELGLLGRLAAIRPNSKYLGFMLTGLVLCLGCALLRIRFAKWPLHPVLFLCWMAWAVRKFALSFFIGWIVKGLIVKFGGGATYQKCKPVMIGIIAGDLLGGLLWMIVGAIYYFITGYTPSAYAIFPG